MTTTFAERHAHGAFFEGQVEHEFKMRACETARVGWERILADHPYLLQALNKAKANLKGPDWIVRDGLNIWLADAKSSMGSQQQIPGAGRYFISSADLVSLEAYSRILGIPLACFILADLYVMTPREVRNKGKYLRDRRCFMVFSAHGRSFDHVFGEPHDGYPITVGEAA